MYIFFFFFTGVIAIPESDVREAPPGDERKGHLGKQNESDRGFANATVQNVVLRCRWR